MSLFGNPSFRWRETYFVMFNKKDRPTAEAVVEAIGKLDGRYQITDVRKDQAGRLESLTILAPHDFAAMDVSYLEGEDVTGQVEELEQDLKLAGVGAEERAKLKRVPDCDARFDIYHFEQIAGDEADEDEEFLDPSSLLNVIECLAKVCRGVGVDPQSGLVL